MKRGSFRIGPLAIVWRDMWTGSRGFEIDWCRGRGRALVSFGFKGMP